MLPLYTLSLRVQMIHVEWKLVYDTTEKIWTSKFVTGHLRLSLQTTELVSRGVFRHILK